MALIPKSAVQEAETDELINKVYDGSADKLFAALLGRKKLSAEQIERLRQIVGELNEVPGMSLLQMSVTGGVMILAITVLRALAMNHVPKKTFLALWGAALLRLVRRSRCPLP